MKIFLLNLFSLEEEDVLFFNISLSENTLKSSPIEIKDEINNGIIQDLSKKNQDFFNNYLGKNILLLIFKGYNKNFNIVFVISKYLFKKFKKYLKVKEIK